MSRFQFVADHQSTFEVKRLCQVVQVARSSFYKWLSAAPTRAARRADDQALAARIAAVHAQDKACGAPRITAELNDGAGEHERVNHKRVARVMREHHIAGIRLRRRVRTTVPDPDGQKVPDLLGRDFTADAPNTKYVGGIQCRRRHWISVTQTLFGAGAVSCRFSRSVARIPSLAATVVRRCLSRRTPARPSARIARSTAPREASGTAPRRRCAVILRRPYNPSGASLRAPWASVVHAAARTASSTTASLKVRAATRPPALRQAR